MFDMFWNALDMSDAEMMIIARISKLWLKKKVRALKLESRDLATLRYDISREAGVGLS